MKVIGLIASPRGKESNTLKLVNAALIGAAAEGARTELVDLYRLRGADEALGLGLEEYFNGRGLTVIEWAERAAEILPPGTWHITFRVGAQPDERTISVEREEGP